MAEVGSAVALLLNTLVDLEAFKNGKERQNRVVHDDVKYWRRADTGEEEKHEETEQKTNDWM